MKVIRSTGNPEQDAKLLSDAAGLKNSESLEKAKERSVASNSFEQRGNSLVATPHREGETIAVIVDEEANSEKDGIKRAANKFDVLEKKVENELKKESFATETKVEVK